MEKISASETLLATYLTTRCRKPEDDTPEYPNSVTGVDLSRLRHHIIRSGMSVGQSEGEEPNRLTLGNMMFN
jgi:hypothetical protein